MVGSGTGPTLAYAARAVGSKGHVVGLMLRPPGSAERVADLHMKLAVGMMLKGVEVSEQKLSEIRNAVADACTQYQSEEGIAVPARIHMLEAIAV